jgi:hypothetical protein
VKVLIHLEVLADGLIDQPMVLNVDASLLVNGVTV